MIGYAADDVGEPCLWIDVVETRGLYERVHNGGATSARVRTGEQIILSSESNAPFILPMSGKWRKFITNGIRISAIKSRFAE